METYKDGQFISEKFNGYNFYKVMVQDSYYTHIITANELSALKEMHKLDLNNPKLIFDSQINF